MTENLKDIVLTKIGNLQFYTLNALVRPFPKGTLLIETESDESGNIVEVSPLFDPYYYKNDPKFSYFVVFTSPVEFSRQLYVYRKKESKGAVDFSFQTPPFDSKKLDLPNLYVLDSDSLSFNNNCGITDANFYKIYECLFSVRYRKYVVMIVALLILLFIVFRK